MLWEAPIEDNRGNVKIYLTFAFGTLFLQKTRTFIFWKLSSLLWKSGSCAQTGMKGQFMINGEHSATPVKNLGFTTTIKP